ncbi:MAG TPA: hypothetical protein VF614_01610, partial [Chthoniobacteraceae bacterium]
MSSPGVTVTSRRPKLRLIGRSGAGSAVGRAILGLVLTQAAYAANGVQLTVDNVAEYARQKSPQLSAARYRIEEARGRLEGAGRLTNPELEVEFAQDTRMPERVFAVAFMQRFPLTARLRLEKAVSAAQVAAAAAEVR